MLRSTQTEKAKAAKIFGPVATLSMAGSPSQPLRIGGNHSTRLSVPVLCSALSHRTWANSMQDCQKLDAVPDVRASTRANTFLAALLRSGGSTNPVKIRDMSEAGAQVESSTVPSVGSVVTLIRGRHTVTGHVAWSATCRFGLHFSNPVLVNEWLARPAYAEQIRVDHILSAVRAGAVPLVLQPDQNHRSSDQLTEELWRVSRLLLRIVDDLASDTQILARCGPSLQSFDLSPQTITAVTELMQSQRPVSAIQYSRLAALGASCCAALKDASGGEVV